MDIMQSYDTDFNGSYQWDGKTPENPSRGSLSAPFRKSFGNFRCGNSANQIWWWKVRCSETSGLGRCTVDGWEIRQTHHEVGSYYTTNKPVPVSSQHPNLRWASCHRPFLVPKKLLGGAKRTGFRLCVCQHPGGRWNHRPMFAWRDEKIEKCFPWKVKMSKKSPTKHHWTDP